MNKIFKVLVLAIVSLTFAFGAGNMDKKPKKMMYQAVPMEKATIVQDGKTKKYCPVCGMTLPMFYKTNHAANHEGHTKQYCSIHCMVEDKELNGMKLSDEKVVDNKTLKFIDAKDATYVVGSSKPGTMSMTSKYGFANESDAIAFQKANGGEIKKYDEVYALVAKGMEKEKAMILKRQGKAAKMGEKIYNKMCKKIDVKFDSVAEAKAYITENKTCGEMKGKPLQQVGLYLGRK